MADRRRNRTRRASDRMRCESRYHDRGSPRRHGRARSRGQLRFLGILDDILQGVTVTGIAGQRPGVQHEIVQWGTVVGGDERHRLSQSRAQSPSLYLILRQTCTNTKQLSDF